MNWVLKVPRGEPHLHDLYTSTLNSSGNIRRQGPVVAHSISVGRVGWLYQPDCGSS